MNYIDEAFKTVEPYIENVDDFYTELKSLLEIWKCRSDKGILKDRPEIKEARKVKKVLEQLTPATRSRLGDCYIDAILEQVDYWEKALESKKAEGIASQKNQVRELFEERCEYLFFQYNIVLSDPAPDQLIKDHRKKYGEGFQHINKNQFARFLMYCLLYTEFLKEDHCNPKSKAQLQRGVFKAYKDRINRRAKSK